MEKRIYVDVHVLQTVPPSCVNRDDTGSPKTAVYGGVTRARISSQCWKHAMRVMFKKDNFFDSNNLGNRTRDLVQAVVNQILQIDHSINVTDAEKFTKDTINLASKDPKKLIIPKDDKKKDIDDSDQESTSDKNVALFFITPIQAYTIAKLVINWLKNAEKPDKATVTEAINKDTGIDVALFGRLVAKAPDVNIDACAQVAHSISTHKVTNEYDYFTAVDDLSSDVGAGHLGTVEYNSSTLYRYATVAVHMLQQQLETDTVDTVKNFVRAFVCAMPDGKQNTFANRTLPDAVYVTLRLDQPVNLVGAFEKAVAPGDGGYAAASAKRLSAYAKKVYGEFASEPAVTLITGELLSELGESVHFNKLIDTLGEKLGAYLNVGSKE